ncbi:MAG TPA: TIGR03032 family protein [Candidatus Nitrosotenuis sp.]|jgi:uncharacterized protein (TIGR03032 family)|nr:TIGR03032 family protein [Candidatus Nitrosotenuis sp.]
MTIRASAPKDDQKQEAKKPLQYVFTLNMPHLLQTLGVTLAVSTYQAHRVMMVSAAPNNRLTMWQRIFERPTGMAARGKSLAVGTKNRVWFLEPSGPVKDAQGNPLPYDLNLAPRRCQITGHIDAHEMAWIGDDLWIVNTRFSCLCTLSPRYSFVPRWKPPFVTRLVPEDRCHLNGLAADEKAVRYVTALGTTDTPEGWRSNRKQGGVILEVPSGEIVSEGICMAHSPRLYEGNLYVLESGTGELQQVDLSTGRRNSLYGFPGYVRGLSFYKGYAFVGLSKIRERRTFGDLPIEKKAEELSCGVYVYELATGEQLAFLRFTEGVTEIFDVQVLPEVRQPHLVGLKDEGLDNLFVLPDETESSVP